MPFFAWGLARSASGCHRFAFAQNFAQRKKISQQELATRAGVHITHISRLENGYYQPSLEVLKKLVEIFEVSADYLINDESDTYEINTKDKSLAERVRLVDSLEDDDRKALLQVIDSMLTKKKVVDLLVRKDAVGRH